MDHELAPGPPHCSHLGSSDLGALGTCLPSLDLPATSQPVQKNPQAGERPGVQGRGRRGLTLLWNS